MFRLKIPDSDKGELETQQLGATVTHRKSVFVLGFRDTRMDLDALAS